MKKVFIEEIVRDGDKNLPGAGRYNPDKGFQSYGRTYSMAARLPNDKLALERSKKLPGPGFYQHPEIIGKNLLQS